MKVLALDLSLTATGVVHDGMGTTTWKPKNTGMHRLCWFGRELAHVIENWTIDLAVVEGPSFASRGNSVVDIGMLHGVIRLALHRSDIPTAVIPPSSLKKYATGKGNATKPDMRMALYKRADIDCPDDNIVDATWLWYMAKDHYGEPELDMPASHRVALDKIDWPALLPLSGGPTGADITISVLENGEGTA